MSTVITQTNILAPEKRLIIPTTAKHSDEIIRDLLIDEEAYEVVLYLNSQMQLEPFDIVEGDVINVVFVPKGKGGGNKVLRSIMMLAVAVASAFTAGAIGGIWGAFAGAGVAMAGGLLVNVLLPMASPTSNFNSDSLNSSTTYSWDEGFNKFQQGLPISKIFGTHKITPPLVSKYIETIDNKQYFNGLYAVNDGEVKEIKEIKINGEAISNFSNVSVEIRMGTLNQHLIGAFDNTRSDKGVNRKLSTDFVQTETIGNAVTELSATLVFPRGIYYANDNGNISSYSVKVVLEYSRDGANWMPMGGDTLTPTYYYSVNKAGYKIKRDANNNYIADVGYAPLPSGVKYSHTTNAGTNYQLDYYYEYIYSNFTTITDATTSTIRKTFKIPNLSPAKYKIRARFYEAPSTSSRYGGECYLEYITESIGDDFIYPRTALIAIRALATDQLSGSAPKITCVVTANSSNPSLICQQILKDVGVEQERILPSFNDWEQHCRNKGYECNIVFDASVNLRKALDLVGTIGRASVMQFGSKFEAIMDRAQEMPTQAFTLGMGNILKDSFSQTFLPILDRASTIEVTYYDKDLDYEPTMIEVSNGLQQAENNKASITLVGCTSRELAVKHAKYLLNCNRYLTETVELKADKDSLVCRYGDVIRVSHDVPQYGFSGRIVSCSATQVVLDRKVIFEAGKEYYIQIRDSSNNVGEHFVVNTGNETDTLTFKVPPNFITYAKYDNYAFGEVGKASKLYRVVKISTSNESLRTLTLLEYNEDVYNDEAQIDVPSISGFTLSNLRATDYIRYEKDNSIETVMQLSWSGASLKYTVSYQKDGGAWQSIVAYNNSLDIVTSEGNYNIIVKDLAGRSISTNYTVVGKLAPPNPVTNLTAYEIGNTFNLNWDYEKDIDFEEFIIFLDNVEIGRTKTDSFSYFSKGLEIKKFSVVTKDTSGNLSSYTDVYHKALPPRDVINFRVDNAFSSLKTLRWDYAKPDDFDCFEIRLLSETSSKWENGTVINSGKITSSPFMFTYDGKTDYVLMIKAVDAGGNYSINPDKIVFNIGNLDTSNIILEKNFAPLWEGEKTNAQVVDGNLKTIAGSTYLYVRHQFYKNKNNLFYTDGIYTKSQFYNEHGFVYGKNIPLLTYKESTTITASGMVKILQDIEGDYRIYYNIAGDDYLYTERTAPFYSIGGFYKNYENYVEYDGAFYVEEGKTIQWMIKTFGGAIEASKFSVIVDVPDVYDYINDFFIPVGGILVPPNKEFKKIKNVIGTVQSGEGVSIKVVSKTPNGAFIKVLDDKSRDAEAIIDIQFKGY